MPKTEWKQVRKKDKILTPSEVRTLRAILENVLYHIEEVGPRDLRGDKEDVEWALEKLS